MAFITLGTETQLQIKVPTIGTTDWADTMRTGTFLKIAQHQHTGSTDGSRLGTGSLVDDAVTGAKIRLDNDEYLKARNQDNSGNINIFKVDTSDLVYMGTPASRLIVANNVPLYGRNADNSADISLIRADLNDEIAFGTVISDIELKHDTYFKGETDVGGSVDLLKVDSSNYLRIQTSVSNFALTNDTPIGAVNNAGLATVEMIKLNTADQIVLGATVTGLVTDKVAQSGDARILTDNTVAATSVGGVETLTSGEATTVRYRITRGTDIREGMLSYTFDQTVPSETFTGPDCGVTFSVSSGALQYVTTSTGNNGNFYFQQLI